MSEKQYFWDEKTFASSVLTADKKQKRHAKLTYFVAFILTFVLCFGFLTAVLLIDTEKGSSNGDCAVQVSASVTPSTVLIYKTTSTSYGYGTGFFISSDGYIVTNAHVIEDYKKVTVQRYQSDVWVDAEVVGFSTVDDVALLKIKQTNTPAVTVGSSKNLKVGETVIAIGNPNGIDGAFSTTQGIVSALHRAISVSGTNGTAEVEMFQFDASVNPGNSGGPLCDADGKVIGMVTRKKSGSDYEGMGYALPIEGVMTIANALKNNTYALKDSPLSVVHPAVGIGIAEVTKDTPYTISTDLTVTPTCDGVLVTSVNANGNAAGKLQIGDVITVCEGIYVTKNTALKTIVSSKKLGDTVTFTVVRNGQNVTVAVQLTVYQ